MKEEQMAIKASKKKHSLIKSEDTKKVKDYILQKAIDDGTSMAMNFGFNMLDAVSNAIKQTIQSAIYKDQAPINFQTKNTAPTNYGKYWTQPIGNTSPKASPGMSLYQRKIYEYDNIEFETYAMAEFCLHRLQYYISQNGYATVGQYYQEARLPYTNVDLKWGWSNLAKATLKRTFNGKWTIVMPRAMEIETE